VYFTFGDYIYWILDAKTERGHAPFTFGGRVGDGGFKQKNNKPQTTNNK